MSVTGKYNTRSLPGVERLDRTDKPYGTWANRRLHTINLWLDNRAFDEDTRQSNELAPNVRSYEELKLFAF